MRNVGGRISRWRRESQGTKGNSVSLLSQPAFLGGAHRKGS